jgi:hypothetical protein
VIASARVWAVRISVSTEDAEGTLSLETDHLIFSIEEGTLRIPLAEVTKVRRVRGSPVLMVDQMREGRDPARFAFFFVKPPPLEPEGRTSKRRTRRKSTAYLSTQNQNKKDLVKAWEEAVKKGAGEANQAG